MKVAAVKFSQKKLVTYLGMAYQHSTIFMTTNSRYIW